MTVHPDFLGKPKFFQVHNRRDNYSTPKTIYEELDREFNFDYDPCTLNPKGLREYDGLGSWAGERIFVNPPYSKPRPWIEKAIEEWKKGKLVVMLLKADTSTNWFHDLILPYAEIRFIRGRLHFSEKGPAPFPSMIVIFKPKEKSI